MRPGQFFALEGTVFLLNVHDNMHSRHYRVPKGWLKLA